MALLSEPIGDKSLDRLPGFGRKTLEKLQQSNRFHHAKDLLNEFVEQFHSDDEQFRLWLMKDHGLPEYRATECTMALLNYIEQAKIYHWSF